tara:strand:- start:608 stop:772 length:165 start_codon:yes stop_codon:yes gene_type:complete
MDVIVDDQYLLDDEFLDIGNEAPLTTENHEPFVEIDDGTGTVSDIDYFGEREED